MMVWRPGLPVDLSEADRELIGTYAMLPVPLTCKGDLRVVAEFLHEIANELGRLSIAPGCSEKQALLRAKTAVWAKRLDMKAHFADDGWELITGRIPESIRVKRKGNGSRTQPLKIVGDR